MNIETVEPANYVFSVFGGHIDKTGCFIPKDLYGTAFYLNNSIFMTCAHTIKNAYENPLVAIGFLNERNTVSYMSVIEKEIFEEVDAGLLVASVDRAKPLRWLNHTLVMLDEVVSVGFPFGYDRKNLQLYTRSFKGYISMVGNYFTFVSKPPIYELSYMCPKGISGAPLLCKYENELVVCGQTIGSEITELLVSSFKETEKRTNEIITYERSEAFHRGIAIRNEAYYSINSKLLKTTFKEYLIQQNLLING